MLNADACSALGPFANIDCLSLFPQSYGSTRCAAAAAAAAAIQYMFQGGVVCLRCSIAASATFMPRCRVLHLSTILSLSRSIVITRQIF